MKQVEHSAQVILYELVILEDCQHATVRENACDQCDFPAPAGCAVNNDSGNVVDGDREEDDENVGRNKSQVKDTTGQQQEYPSEPVREQEIEKRRDWEKHQKLERIEQHRAFNNNSKAAGVRR
jgi:hypothetical protein